MSFHFNIDPKKNLNILGIMSGTSCDGLDFALVSVSMIDEKPNFTVIKTHFEPFEELVKTELQQIIISGEAKLSHLTDLLYRLSEKTSDCINQIFMSESIDLIGAHGQTVFHDGVKSQTFQLVSSQLISKKTGIPTVSDFRTGDTALGGEGAPLVSFFDYECWNEPDKNQLIINIGGISNGTYLPKNIQKKDVISFDFGPGNTFIDLAMKTLYEQDYDKNGEIAMQGEVNESLLKQWIQNEPYFIKPFPKSSGREYFNQDYCTRLLDECDRNRMPSEDCIATLTAFTCESILFQSEYFKFSIDEVLMTGGGAFNKAIREYFSKKIKLTEVDKETIEFKEAVIFALLAYYFVLEKPANLPSVTGAKEATVLGSFSF